MWFAVAGCGGSGGDGGTPLPTAPVQSATVVSGSASGVSANGRVVLADNGGAAITVATDGTFSFPTRLATAQAFSVTVSTVSSGEACVVVHGAGSAATASVASTVQLLCGPAEQRAFHPAATMRTPRSGHKLVKLDDGTIVAFGGQDASTSTPAVERYDSKVDAWTSLAPLASGQSVGDAIALAGQKVLLDVFVSTGRATFVIVPMLYDVGSGNVTAAGSFAKILAVDSWVRLADGRVLATDGASAEIYDPATNAWTATPPLNGVHVGGVLVTMNSGDVLLAGVQATEIYGLQSGRWAPSGSAAHTRLFPLARLLPNGRVLVVGGTESVPVGVSGFVKDAEAFDPSTGQWLPAGTLAVERNGFTATLMPTGKVVAAGGNDTAFSLPTKVVFPTVHQSAEAYDPATNTWSPWADMSVPRTQHAAILTNEGKLLVTGGVSFSPDATLAVRSTLQTSSEIGW